MHWTKRVQILEKEVCPKLPKDLKDWNFIEETPSSLTVTEEPKPDPTMMALVLYDEMAREEEQKKNDQEPPVIEIYPARQLPPPRNPSRHISKPCTLVKFSYVEFSLVSDTPLIGSVKVRAIHRLQLPK